MSRMNHGPLTRTKGKLGGVVFQQYEGMQIAREYQPNVKNPQSQKQTIQRAKFKLASQIVAEFATIINERLAKLSIYGRIRRGAAVSAIVSAAATEGAEAAGISMNEVATAINARSMNDIESPVVTETPGTGIAVTAAEGDIVAVVMVGYDEDGSYISRVDSTYTADGSAQSIGVVSANNNNYMVVALRANTEVGRATISNLTTNTANFFNEVSRAVNNGDIWISNIVGGSVLGTA